MSERKEGKLVYLIRRVDTKEYFKEAGLDKTPWTKEKCKAILYEDENILNDILKIIRQCNIKTTFERYVKTNGEIKNFREIRKTKIKV